MLLELAMKRICELIYKIIKKAGLIEDQKLLTLCCKLILQIGLITANAEYLVKVA